MLGFCYSHQEKIALSHDNHYHRSNAREEGERYACVVSVCVRNGCQLCKIGGTSRTTENLERSSFVRSNIIAVETTLVEDKLICKIDIQQSSISFAIYHC